MRRTFSGFTARPQTALCGKRPQFAENFRLTEEVKPRDSKNESRNKSRGEGKSVRVSPPYRANRSISFARFARNQESLARGKPRFSAARPQFVANLRLTEGVKPRDFLALKPLHHRAARGNPFGFPLRLTEKFFISFEKFFVNALLTGSSAAAAAGSRNSRRGSPARGCPPGTPPGPEPCRAGRGSNF